MSASSRIPYGEREEQIRAFWARQRPRAAKSKAQPKKFHPTAARMRESPGNLAYYEKQQQEWTSFLRKAGRRITVASSNVIDFAAGLRAASIAGYDVFRGGGLSTSGMELYVVLERP